jgi:hypothetical protein
MAIIDLMVPVPWLTSKAQLRCNHDGTDPQEPLEARVRTRMPEVWRLRDERSGLTRLHPLLSSRQSGQLLQLYQQPE